MAESEFEGLTTPWPLVRRRHRGRGGRGRRRMTPLGVHGVYDLVTRNATPMTQFRLPPPPTMPRVLRGALQYIAPPILPQTPPFQWPAIWGPPPITTTAPPAVPPTMTYRPPIAASIGTLTPTRSRTSGHHHRHTHSTRLRRRR